MVLRQQQAANSATAVAFLAAKRAAKMQKRQELALAEENHRRAQVAQRRNAALDALARLKHADDA